MLGYLQPEPTRDKEDLMLHSQPRQPFHQLPIGSFFARFTGGGAAPPAYHGLYQKVAEEAYSVMNTDERHGTFRRFNALMVTVAGSWAPCLVPPDEAVHLEDHVQAKVHELLPEVAERHQTMLALGSSSGR